jgi:hypothetical protein
MIRVCRTCKGSGLSNLLLRIRSDKFRVGGWDLKNHIRLCRTCHGRGVEGAAAIEELAAHAVFVYRGGEE